MAVSKYDLFYKLDQAIDSNTLPDFFVEEFEVEDLRKLCKAAKLSSNGDKDALAKRLQKYIMAPKSRVAQKIQSILAIFISLCAIRPHQTNKNNKTSKKARTLPSTSILRYLAVGTFVNELIHLIVLCSEAKQRRSSRVRTIKHGIAKSRTTNTKKKRSFFSQLF